MQKGGFLSQVCQDVVLLLGSFVVCCVFAMYIREKFCSLHIRPGGDTNLTQNSALPPHFQLPHVVAVVFAVSQWEHALQSLHASSGKKCLSNPSVCWGSSIYSPLSLPASSSHTSPLRLPRTCPPHSHVIIFFQALLASIFNYSGAEALTGSCRHVRTRTWFSSSLTRQQNPDHSGCTASHSTGCMLRMESIIWSRLFRLFSFPCFWGRWHSLERWLARRCACKLDFCEANCSLWTLWSNVTLLLCRKKKLQTGISVWWLEDESVDSVSLCKTLSFIMQEQHVHLLKSQFQFL